MKNAKHFMTKNGSLILACVSVIGVVATAIISSKAAISSYKKVEELKKDNDNDKDNITKKEIVKAAAEDYIPVALIVGGSIWCVAATFIFNKRAQSSLAAAYMLVANSYNEYKSKIKEIYGKEAAENIESSIAEDNYIKHMQETSKDEEELFYDEYSEFFFISTMENVINEEERLNKKLKLLGYADLREFYAFLGVLSLHEIDMNEFDILGWSLDRIVSETGLESILFTHTRMRTENGEEFWRISTPLCNPGLIFDF